MAKAVYLKFMAALATLFIVGVASAQAQNAVYPAYKDALLAGAADVALDTGTVKAALVDTGTYTYSAAHDFLDDLSGVVGTAQTLTGKSISGGWFDSADVTWSAVTGATVEAIVIYIDTGNPATSRLVHYMDTGQTGLPVTPNGGDISYTVDVLGWFRL